MLTRGHAMTQQNLSHRVLRLAVPAMFEGLLVTAVGLVSLTTVNHLGASAQAAVALANQINVFALMGINGLAVGTSVVVAHHTGAGAAERARTAALQGWLMTLILTAGLSVIGWLFTPALMRLLGATPELIEMGGGYLRVLFTMLILVGSTASLSASWRGYGNTSIPMLTTTLGNSLFVLLGMWLVRGGLGVAPLGIAGLGWAYVIGHACAGLAMLATWLHRSGPLRPVRWAVDWSLMRRIVNISIPSSIEQLALSGGQLMFLRTVTSISVEAYAAHSIMLQISNINHALVQGPAIAVSTLVGQNLGAGDVATAKRVTYRVELAAVLLMVTTAVLQFIFVEPIAGLFSSDAAVIAAISSALPWLAAYMPALAAYSVVGGGLRGAGDTRWTMVIAIAGIWVMRLPVVWFVVHIVGLGLAGIWLSMAVDFFIRALLAQFRLPRMLQSFAARRHQSAAGPA